MSRLPGGMLADKASPASSKTVSPLRQWGTIAACILSIVVLGWVLTRSFRSDSLDPASASRTLTLIDSATGEVFSGISTPDGAISPYENPKTGKRTLFPPEACYWTRDGKAKVEPTLVLLNDYAGKPGPTICPDCGREVFRHNPLPPEALMVKAYEEAEAKKKAGS
jgi:hypothetical protein